MNENDNELSQKYIFQYIKKISGQNNNLVVNKYFKILTGDYNSALMLSQLLYWTDKTQNEWVYKTHTDWFDELVLTRREVDTCKNKLKNADLISTCLKKVRGVPTTHYKINKTALINQLGIIFDKEDEKGVQRDAQDSAMECTETCNGMHRNALSSITDTTSINYNTNIYGVENPCMNDEINENLDKLKSHKKNKINSKPFEALKPKEKYYKLADDNFGDDIELLDLWTRYVTLTNRSLCNPTDKYTEMFKFLEKVINNNEKSLIKSILHYILEENKMGKINPNYRDAYSKIFELYRNKTIWKMEKEKDKKSGINMSGNKIKDYSDPDWYKSEEELFKAGREAYIQYRIDYLTYSRKSAEEYVDRMLSAMSEEELIENGIQDWVKG